MKKRILTTLLLVCLILTLLPVTAFAAQETGHQAAAILYDLGLFQGTGTDEAGSPVFELNRTARRDEAVIMLIRLLGREREALACTDSHPFTDVAPWADRYIAYAYREKLTSGVGTTTFGSDTEASGNMYLTFILRALGCDDAAPDAPYDYTSAAAYAVQTGVTEHDYSAGSFLRGDAAQVSLDALRCNINGTGSTLIQRLADDGAVTAGAARKAGFDVSTPNWEGTAVSVALRPKQSDDEVWRYLDPDALMSAIPGAAYVYPQLIEDEESRCAISPMAFSSQEEFSLTSAALDLWSYPDLAKKVESGSYPAFSTESQRFDPSRCAYRLYVLDRDRNVIARADDLFVQNQDAITFTRLFQDLSIPREKALDWMRASLSQKDSLQVKVDLSSGSDTWFDGVYTSANYPVYVNGASPAKDADYCIVTYQNVDQEMASQGLDLDGFLLQVQGKLLTGEMGYIQSLDEQGNPLGEPIGPLDPEGPRYNIVWDGQGHALDWDWGVSLVTTRPETLFIGVYDTSGNLLGYQLLPPNFAE